MTKFNYKIHIPFNFSSGNSFYKTQLNLIEFEVDEVKLKLHLESSNGDDTSYICAQTYIGPLENTEIELIDIADMKVGKVVQSFFDGISKALNNAAFYRIYGGDSFHVAYEVSYDGVTIKSPKVELNHGYYLDDEIIEKAIRFVCTKDQRMKQAFIYLKDGEYFVEIGMYSNAVLSFVFMTEFLVNCILRENNLLNSRDEFKEKYAKECSRVYQDTIDKTGSPTFAYRKFVFGLSKAGLEFPQQLVEAVDNCYNLRNKLAHGYSILEAFELCKITCEEAKVDEYNLIDCMRIISSNTIDIYNWFSDFYEK